MLWEASLTVLHVLCNDVNGFRCNNSEEAHQVRVLQRLHEVGLPQEGADGHGPGLQALDGHISVVVVNTCPKRRSK